MTQGASWATLDSHRIQGSSDAPVRFTGDAKIEYAIDHTSDARRPVKSADGGQTWAALPGDPTGAGAFNLFADYANPNRVLVADWMGL